MVSDNLLKCIRRDDHQVVKQNMRRGRTAPAKTAATAMIAVLRLSVGSSHRLNQHMDSQEFCPQFLGNTGFNQPWGPNEEIIFHDTPRQLQWLSQIDSGVCRLNHQPTIFCICSKPIVVEAQTRGITLNLSYQ